MPVDIHPTAVVDPKAQLGTDVTVGPYAIIEEDVQVGDGTIIESHAVVAHGTRMGKRCHVHHYAIVGTTPQDLKFEGEETTLEIGDNCIIRELCTLNRGTKAAGLTKIGNDCAFLTGVHVGHDCILGNKVVISNGTMLGGHVEIGNCVTLSALIAVRQFCKIGDFVMVTPRITVQHDIVPFAMFGGEIDNPRVRGINKVRLEREGVSEERRKNIKRFFKQVFRQALTVDEAVLKLGEDYPGDQDMLTIVNFIKASERGVGRMV